MTTILKGTALRKALADAGLFASKGCMYAVMPLGDNAEALVEFDFDEGEEAIFDLNSPMCGPGSPAYAEIGGVMLNGSLCNPSLLSSKLISDWEDSLTEEAIRQAREDYECAMEERREREQER